VKMKAPSIYFFFSFLFTKARQGDTMM